MYTLCISCNCYGLFLYLAPNFARDELHLYENYQQPRRGRGLLRVLLTAKCALYFHSLIIVALNLLCCYGEAVRARMYACGSHPKASHPNHHDQTAIILPSRTQQNRISYQGVLELRNCFPFASLTDMWRPERRVTWCASA
eukprot:147000-Prorocentrum_minimum.AAC.1